MDNLFKEYKGVFDEKVNEFEKNEKKQKGYSYNPFPFQDALGFRNPKNVWIEYMKLIFQGVEPEELIYKILSKINIMLSITKNASAEDLGIKEYPYIKSKKDLKNWNKSQLENFYTEIVSIYVLSRTESIDLGNFLEKAVLKL